MMFYFIFLIVYEMFNCLPCTDGKNFCNRCNPVTKLCAQCKYDVFIPDEDGGCKGSQKCVNGENFCSECEDDKKNVKFVKKVICQMKMADVLIQIIVKYLLKEYV